MTKFVATQNSPMPVDVEAGNEYYYCTCGVSKTMPLCDGAHKGTEYAPIVYKAEETKTVYFCACGASKQGHLCDGAHKEL